jgi:hypothetical protein
MSQPCVDHQAQRIRGAQAATRALLACKLALDAS